MSTIYIHIGLGKTGTSAIQNSAFSNIKKTSQTKYFPYGLIGNVHNGLADAHPQFSAQEYGKSLSLIKKINRNYDYLISSEFLCYSSSKAIEELISALKSEGFKVKVIFVYRNFSDLILSSYLQALKSGYGLIKGESIIDYASRMEHILDIKAMLNKWASCEIIPINYDENKSDFVNSFMNKINLAIDQQSKPREQINTSLLCEFIPLIRNYDLKNHDISSGKRALVITQLLKASDCLAEYTQKDFHKNCIQEIAMRMDEKLSKLLLNLSHNHN